MEVCTVVAIVTGETSSLFPWLFFTFIARLLNVKCRKGPKSKVHSPNMSQGVQLPFAFHFPSPAFLSLKLFLLFSLFRSKLSASVQKTDCWFSPRSQWHIKNWFLSCSLENVINLCMSNQQHLLLFQFWNSTKEIQNTVSWLFPL